MVKKKKMILISAGILLVLVGLYLGVFSFLGSTYGFDTLSLGKTTFTTSDPNHFLQGEIFLVQVAEGGLGQSLSGSKSSDQIDSETGKQTENGFTIELAGKERTCNYVIDNTYTKRRVWEYGATDTGEWFSETNARNICKNLGFMVHVAKVGFSPYYCVYKNPSQGTGGYPANLEDNAFFKFETDVSLIIDGQSPITKSISNGHTTTTTLGNTALVKWNGLLGQGSQCPSPFTQEVMALYKNGKWNTIDKDKYELYENASIDVESRVEFNNPATVPTLQRMMALVQEANMRGNTVMSSNLPLRCIGCGGATSSTTGGVDDGQVVLVTDGSIKVPVFTFYVKADSLGISQPIGQVSNLQVSDIEFETGDPNGADIRVWVNCVGGFSMIGNTKQVQVNPNDSAVVYIGISGICSADITNNCTVHVKNQFTQEDTTAISRATCSPQFTCTTGDKRCFAGEIIKQCDGIGYNIVVEDCGSQNKTCDLDAFGNIACTGGTPPSLCGNKECDFGEILTCPQDCIIPPVVCNKNNVCEPERGETKDNCSDCIGSTITCEELPGDGIFVLGYTTATTTTPEYLFGFIPIQVGIKEVNQCVPIHNVSLIVIVFAIMIIAVAYFMTKPKGRQPIRRRRKRTSKRRKVKR